MSVQVQREKKAPTAPTLDPDLARRLPLRLLLADDNPINQKVGLSVLHKLGYRADLANNGLEVLKALEQKAYDILFLDVQMPEMDGLEAARQICQRWPAEKRPRIIAMTGNALMGDREKCLQAGMDDYISKPVRIGELQSALERWGRMKTRKADTAFLCSASKPARPTICSTRPSSLELRNMPPSDGVSMLQELVDLFLESAPQRIAQISQSINDGPMLAFHAHALKSMGLNLGAKRIVELSQKLEDLGRDQKCARRPRLAPGTGNRLHPDQSPAPHAPRANNPPAQRALNSCQLKPDRLNYGDTIGIIAPASAPPDPKNIDRSVAVLERLGFKPKLAPNVRQALGVPRRQRPRPRQRPHEDVHRPQGEGHHLRARRLRHRPAPAAARLPDHPRQPQDLHRLQRHHLAPLRLPGQVQPRFLPRPDAQLGLRQAGPPRLHPAKLPQDADATSRAGQHS